MIQTPKSCGSCGKAARYGFSPRAEAKLEEIRPLCRGCLIAQLSHDYRSFAGKAVVVQPASGPPVYVFQPLDEWAKAFPASQILRDVATLLRGLGERCERCGAEANFAWVNSRGLDGENFSRVLDNGIVGSLFKGNPRTQSLCSECCVRAIADELQAQDLEYVEVCAPRGSADGFVIPMGY